MALPYFSDSRSDAPSKMLDARMHQQQRHHLQADRRHMELQSNNWSTISLKFLEGTACEY
ncbi:MAG: hypothetical protein CL912_09570 [Deltaproteobacteria bacterium]|nr:hypothetical protein [Deltaproteobacteria bacterium]